MKRIVVLMRVIWILIVVSDLTQKYDILIIFMS